MREELSKLIDEFDVKCERLQLWDDIYPKTCEKLEHLSSQVLDVWSTFLLEDR